MNRLNRYLDPGNDTTPCNCKGLSSTDIEMHQRARRDSNPQLPDRQSAGVRQNSREKQPISEHGDSNPTTATERQGMTDDDMLLSLIEAWPDLTTARRRMIVAIVKASGLD